ncbi:MAG TPA: serine hydrolase domain-containing protein [Thermoanaerobaculia bacterium]|nr:serine hydrolase domain-containing protein [Thermoanaerobaculia bacterium]
MAGRAAFRIVVPSLLLALTLPAAARPPSSDSSRLAAIADPVVQNAMERHRTPGLMLAVVDNGRLVLEKGYGVRSLPSGPAPGPDTVFAIGSISKAVTAVGTLLLVQDGKLRLNDPAAKYLAGLPESWRRITVRQFMTHTSGIPRIVGAPTFAIALKRAAGMPLSFKPGSDQEYNNFNFAVVGKIVEAVSGQPYLEFMQRRVFAPLHMGSTGVGVESQDRATGYVAGAGGLHSAAPDFAPGDYGVPAGGLESTVADLLKLEAALREGRLLQPDATCQMWTPAVPPGTHYAWNFTPGWQRRVSNGTLVIAKNGAVTGFTSMIQMVPSRGEAVILLWNLKHRGNDFWAASADLLQRAFGIPRPAPGDGGGGE